MHRGKQVYFLASGLAVTLALVLGLGTVLRLVGDRGNRTVAPLPAAQQQRAE